MRTYSDLQLTAAVASSRSWRGVLRALDLRSTSAGAARSVRRQADLLDLDHSHFTGQRRWSDAELTAAVGASTSWMQVLERLGLSSSASVRRHAEHLGTDVEHLIRRPPTPGAFSVVPLGCEHIARAGSLIAATWFELAGAEVSWPLEACRYDLLVHRQGTTERVQVKTTRVREGRSWIARITATSTRGGPYDPGDIDHFFIIDGDRNLYLIPIMAVAGRRAIVLSAYERYRLAPLGL